MAQVLVRGLPADVVEKLRLRARKNERSLEAEVRTILHEAVRQSSVPAIEEAQRVRALFAGRSFSDSAPLVREDRSR